MEDHIFSKNKALLSVAFIVLFLITFFPLFSFRLGNADDLNYWVNAQMPGLFKNGLDLSQYNGRFYFIFTYFFFSVPHIGDNILVLKILHLGPILLCVYLMSRILYKISSSESLSVFFILIFLVTLQVSRHTSLFACFPFYFSFSFSLILFSVLMLIKYYQTRKKIHFVFSVFFYLLGLLFYEAYLPLLIIYLFIIFAYDQKREMAFFQKIRLILMQFLPFLGVGILYLITYVVYRHFFPSAYGGVKMGSDLTVQTVFVAIWKLISSAVPLAVFEEGRPLFIALTENSKGYYPIVSDIIIHSKVEWLVKGIIASFLGYKLLLYIPRSTNRFFVNGIIVSLLLIIVPNIPIALSEKYIFYIFKSNLSGYVTTFFSFLGIVMFITLVVGKILSIIPSRGLKMAMALAISGGIFLCSVLTDMSNYYHIKDIKNANLPFEAMDELIKTDHFKNLGDHTCIYSPDLWKSTSFMASLTPQSINWDYYVPIKTGKYFHFYKNVQDFKRVTANRELDKYYITMRQALKSEDVLLTLSKIDSIGTADSVISPIFNKTVISYFSNYPIFTLGFKLGRYSSLETCPFSINNHTFTANINGYFEFTIYNTDKTDPATIFVLQCEGIDVNSINVSNIVNPENGIYYL